MLDYATQCSQSAAHLYEQLLQVKQIMTCHDPYAVCRDSCLELYYCNMVEWFWWDSRLILTTNQCFETVGSVTWPVKVVPEMTYNMSSGTLSLYTITITIIDDKQQLLAPSLYMCSIVDLL